MCSADARQNNAGVALSQRFLFRIERCSNAAPAETRDNSTRALRWCGVCARSREGALNENEIAKNTKWSEILQDSKPDWLRNDSVPRPDFPTTASVCGCCASHVVISFIKPDSEMLYLLIYMITSFISITTRYNVTLKLCEISTKTKLIFLVSFHVDLFDGFQKANEVPS